MCRYLFKDGREISQINPSQTLMNLQYIFLRVLVYYTCDCTMGTIVPQSGTDAIIIF